MRSCISLALASLTTVFVACGPASGPADCSAPTKITTDTVSGGVTLAKGCYAADASLEVKGGTLTLKPGVVIQFGNNVEMAVLTDGRLNAVGTDADPIVLEGKNDVAGFWSGLTFMDSKGAANDLEYVTLKNGGGAPHLNGIDNTSGALAVYGNSLVKMAHGTITGSTSAGFGARGELDLTDCTITSNDFPGWVSPNNVPHLGTSSHFTGNTHDQIQVWSSSPIDQGFMDKDSTWQVLDVPYHLEAEFTVTSGATFTVDPGVTLAVATGQWIDIDATSKLMVNGTAAKPVTISGYEGVAGSWHGIVIRSPANEIHYTTITDGGASPDFNNAELFLQGAGSVTLDNVTIANSSGWGIGMSTSGSVSGCPSVTFSGNTSGDVWPDVTQTDCP